MNRDRWLLDQRQALVGLLEEQYGLTGLADESAGLQLLSGEYDCNLAVAADQGSFLLKVMRADCSVTYVDMQCALLEHVTRQNSELPTQRLVRTRADAAHTTLQDGDSHRIAWLTTFLPGRLLASARPQTADLHHEVGLLLGRLDSALQGFDHPELDRACPWDLRHAGWSTAELEVVTDDASRRQVAALSARFVAEWQPELEQLRRSPIHGDGNDHNLLVSYQDGSEHVSGVVDFGDACRTALVCEPAIAGAYAMLCTDDPIEGLTRVVAAYHKEMPLQEQEVALMLPLALMRLCTTVVNSAKASNRRPGDDYMTVHERQAQRVLRDLQGCDFHIAESRLRLACAMSAWPRGDRLSAWLEQQRGRFAEPLGDDLQAANGTVLDLSFESLLAGEDCETFDPEACQNNIERKLAREDSLVGIGRYGEPRPFYLGSLFGEEAPNGRRRTQHLGVDLFAPAGTSVRAPLDGQVVSASVNTGTLDYGGLVILRHRTPDESFGVLYGHLDPASIDKLDVGMDIAAGETFATLGAPPDNGDWPPHLHVQLLACDPESTSDIAPGVADPDHFEAISKHYPDPAPLLNLPPEASWQAADQQALLDRRRAHLSTALRFGHGGPLHIVRGRRHCLYDQHGRRYLDAYNNVPHVGHAHPHVLAAIREQSGLLATNTRYLGDSLASYAEQLTAKLPDSLSICMFVNSGSEANELALRLARAHSNGSELLVMDHGYHGNTTGAVGISPYKFRHQPGPERAAWAHISAQPDVYRGPFRGEDAGTRYAASVREELEHIRENGGSILGYLSECLPSVGGQIVPPPGFFAAVYEAVREAGGVCIADDVQTALGRTGETFFGFECVGVTPDILVLGKPLGNGYPIGAVITTEAIAASFAQGPEFFSTFGGNTVACAAGLAVLEVLEQEGLQQQARSTGERLLAGLRELQGEHEVIGDVRGSGLFLGIDLVANRETREPAGSVANHLKNRLRERHVLVGTEGPADNVLKIRPPMTFDAQAADVLLTELARTLREDQAQARAGR